LCAVVTLLVVSACGGTTIGFAAPVASISPSTPSTGGEAEEPPLPASVVAPRLLREFFGYELAAWKQRMEHVLGAAVHESWTVDEHSETDIDTTLRLYRGRAQIGEKAVWRINIALDRPLTPAEERLVEDEKGIVPRTVAARRYEGFPVLAASASRPIELMGEETLSPGLHVLVAQVISAERYDAPLIVRAGKLDESLLRGRSLAGNPSPRIRELRLARGAKIYRETFIEGHAGPLRRSSIYGLSQAYNSGPMRLILKWRTGSTTLKALLRRPIESVIYFR
jgi:hypothetical protein